MKKLKRFTRKRSLEVCRDLWDWLSKNPKKAKKDWPGWYDIASKYKTSRNCPCCDYIHQFGIVLNSWDICPLKGYWVKGDTSASCLKFDSIYDKWKNASIECFRKDNSVNRNPRRKAKYYAEKIRDAAITELEVRYGVKS